MAGYQLGLVLHPTRDVSEVVGIIERWAMRHRKTLLVRAEDRHRVPPSVEPVPEAAVAARADALISIGGDGTMLGA
ncbi:NAD(+) kinase, partial [Micromonospora yasonensis]|nr:NAD(+) kinase [Micromonospora yasonensis]